MLIYRGMRDADLDAVYSIEQEANAHPWTREQIQDCLRSRNDQGIPAGKEGMIAYIRDGGEETIVAFAIFSWVLDENSLLNLCVSVDYQGLGYGKAFLKHLLEQARAGNILKYFLEVRASNHRAIRLYESSDFKKSGGRKNYYPASGGREDALHYFWEP